eukprot:7774974-Pyramimonas_sp.AAC.1
MALLETNRIILRTASQSIRKLPCASLTTPTNPPKETAGVPRAGRRREGGCKRRLGPQGTPREPRCKLQVQLPPRKEGGGSAERPAEAVETSKGFSCNLTCWTRRSKRLASSPSSS